MNRWLYLLAIKRRPCGGPYFYKTRILEILKIEYCVPVIATNYLDAKYYDRNSVFLWVSVQGSDSIILTFAHTHIFWIYFFDSFKVCYGYFLSFSIVFGPDLKNKYSSLYPIAYFDFVVDFFVVYSSVHLFEMK